MRNKLFLLTGPVVLAFVTLTLLSWLFGAHLTSAKSNQVANNSSATFLESTVFTETNTVSYLPIILKPSLPPPSLPPPLTVADFDTCASPNNLGGEMGGAYDPPDILRESYVPETGRGCVARLEYDIENWAAFWMKLQFADLSPYKENNGVITFDIKADEPVPGGLKIEIKRLCVSNQGCGEMLICYTSDITSNWQTVSLSLDDFYPVDWALPLSTWSSVEELVFTFESRVSSNSGVVYLDDITFQALQQPQATQCQEPQ